MLASRHHGFFKTGRVYVMSLPICLLHLIEHWESLQGFVCSGRDNEPISEGQIYEAIGYDAQKI